MQKRKLAVVTSLDDKARPPRIVDHKIVIDLPPVIPESTLASAMDGSPCAADLRSLLKTRGNVHAFVRKLDDFLTSYHIGGNGSGVLLREVIEGAVRFYHSAANMPVGTDVARFFAAAISITSMGLTSYKVASTGKKEQWNPMHEGMRTFIERTKAKSLTFEIMAMPDAAHRNAAKHVVVAACLQFEDIVLMERAQVEYRLFDAC